MLGENTENILAKGLINEAAIRTLKIISVCIIEAWGCERDKKENALHALNRQNMEVIDTLLHLESIQGTD